MGYLINGIAYVINILLEVYIWIIIIRAILSWTRPNPLNPFVRTIYRLVDPVTYKMSRMFPTRIGMLDLAPFILILAALFVQKFFVDALYKLGASM